MTDAASKAPLELVVDPPMSRDRVLWVAFAGFGLVVGLVLLAAWLGYRGTDRIQNTAHTLIREHLIQTERGAQVEAQIVGQTEEMIEDLTSVLALCFLLAAGTAGLTLWVMRRAFAKLEWQAAELAHVSWHMIDGHEKMARRFSHEMHDELGQSLSGLRRMLSGIPANDFDSIRPECIGVVDEVLQNVRKLSQALRPVILDDFGLDSALRWLCERFTRRTGVPVEYKSNFNQRLAETEETHLFRIAQEALTNIARHADAAHATVSLDVNSKTVRLDIADDGKGLGVSPGERSPSLGMVGMRARARQLDGELVVQNRSEGGLQIRVEVPLHKVEPNADQENPGIVG